MNQINSKSNTLSLTCESLICKWFYYAVRFFAYFFFYYFTQFTKEDTGWTVA